MNEREPDIDVRELGALYRALGRDEPSPALDEAILNAARAEAAGARNTKLRLPGKAFNNTRLPGAAGLSAAAGLMVAVLTALLFAGLDERVAFTTDDGLVGAATEESLTLMGPVSVAGGTGNEPAGLAPGPLVEPLPRGAAQEVRRNVVLFRDPVNRVVEGRVIEGDTGRPLEALTPPRRAEVASDQRVEIVRPPSSARTAGTTDARSAASMQELLQLVENARLTEVTPSEAPPRPADDWLTAIQELLDDGRLAAAEQELEAFRNAYPDVNHNAVLRYPPANEAGTGLPGAGNDLPEAGTDLDL